MTSKTKAIVEEGYACAMVRQELWVNGKDAWITHTWTQDVKNGLNGLDMHLGAPSDAHSMGKFSLTQLKDKRVDGAIEAQYHWNADNTIFFSFSYLLGPVKEPFINALKESGMLEAVANFVIKNNLKLQTSSIYAEAIGEVMQKMWAADQK